MYTVYPCIYSVRFLQEVIGKIKIFSYIQSIYIYVYIPHTHVNTVVIEHRAVRGVFFFFLFFFMI